MTNLPDFIFATGTRVLRASGAMTPVTFDNALDEAKRAGSAVVGLIPFDPDMSAYLFVPERLEEQQVPVPEQTVALAEPVSVTGRQNDRFRAAVATAVERMKAGELSKIVLSRVLTARYAPGALNLEALYNNLRAQQRSAFNFAVRLPDGERGMNGSYLMGASPELVFRTEGRAFKTHPLAGSAPRIAEPGSAEDEAIRDRLFASPKDRHEHAYVINDIAERLAPIAEELNVPQVPSLLQTPQLWHLGTPIDGVLKEGLTCLDGARAIHPTPAICGAPTEKALELIRQLESFERRYFGGLVGYMDAEGNGEWALVLRCAQVSPEEAVLYAGAGIVAESDPELEHTETGTKLGSFGRALGVDTLGEDTP